MAKSYDGLTVEIINWKTYNQRKDVKAPSWFRMDHGLFENPEFYDFNQGELLVWIYLLCVASRKSISSIRLSYAHAERIGRLKIKDIESAILKLQTIQVVHVDVTDAVRARYADGTDSPATQQDKTNITRQDKQTEACSEVSKLTCGAVSQLSGNPLVESALEAVTKKTQEAWIAAYQDPEFIKTEIAKAVAWEASNPKKKSKQFSRFMGGWLSRGWETHRRGIPSTGNFRGARPKPANERNENLDDLIV